MRATAFFGATLRSTGTLVPELQDEYFGVKIAANEPIVAERAMYSNAGGQVWGAGTNATATRLP